MNNIFILVGIIIIGYGIFSMILNKKRFEKQQSELFKFNGMKQKDLEKTLTELGSIAAKARKNILIENEDELRFSANKQAEINKDAIKTSMHAIKEGLTEEETVYCKHCGASIDADSKFCKSCGKEQ